MHSDPQGQDSPDQRLAEAETMIWALLDDQLDEAEIAKLEQLLTTDEAIRRRYAECVHLHVDLTGYFSPPRPAASEGDILRQVIAENLLGNDSAPSPLPE